MSMTQVALLKSENLPTKKQIEEKIREFGYELSIKDDFDKFEDLDGLECELNGNQTFFELYFDEPKEFEEYEFIKDDLKDQNLAISFIWGADFTAGASIGLINASLIELCDAKSYYLDDEMKYTKEDLLNETPEYLKHINK